MLPAILVTFATFLLDLYTASPVYNMQPAFITANIGTTGRNIRNLPCISRKNNQSGVCMFAIDCLKANGTHLGTCIDRFYFGSCCHIEPVHDIIENTIDTDIIPAREPPERLSSTLKPIFTTSTTHTTTTVTTTKPKIPVSLLTTKQTSTTRLSTSKVTTTTTATTTKRTPSTTTTQKIITSKPEAVEEETTIGYKLTTFQSVDGAIETTNATTTTTTSTTTTKPPKTTTKVTSKPIKTKPRPTPKPTTTLKPKPTRTTVTTTKPTSKPVRLTTKTTKPTTKRPNTTSKKPPSTTKPTKKIITTRSTTTTTKPTTRSTPTTIRTTSSTTTTALPPSVSTISVTTLKPTTEWIKRNETLIPITTVNNSQSQKVPSTTEPQIVTWTVADIERNSTSSSIATTTNSTDEEWMPITSPDGWVLLPSVPPSTTTGKPPDTIMTTVSSLPTITTTIESTSKPSITFIPIESTTMTSNLSSVDEGSTTMASTPSTPVTPPLTTPSSEELRPVNMSDFTDVCGRRMYPEARIVGGEKSSFGKWPWQISLRQWRTSTYLHKCGAALLNENWAITAAHCVDNVPPSDLLLRLGEHDLSTESEPYLHQERRVQIVASHPQFDPRTFEYDLALLRFYEPVTFQPNILPVCVPQTDENFVGRTAYVTGWGRLYEDGPLPSILQEVSVPVINNTVCESMYRAAGYIEHIPHIFICAGWRRGGFDSCEGDSGGPMVIQREDKRFLLAGVISWGIGCAEPNQPGVYTRISEFRDWINQILQF